MRKVAIKEIMTVFNADFIRFVTDFLSNVRVREVNLSSRKSA